MANAWYPGDSARGAESGNAAEIGHTGGTNHGPADSLRFSQRGRVESRLARERPPGWL